MTLTRFVRLVCRWWVCLFEDYEAADEQQIDAAMFVEDIDTLHAKWQANGVEMVTGIMQMPFGRTFLFRTPDGHVLRILSQA